MNAIGFVFCILTILSFGAILSLEKQVGAHRLRSSYLGHIAANREILDQTTSAFYASLKHTASSEDKEKKEQKTRESAQTKSSQQPQLPSPINSFCARLNLFPLIQHDLNKEPYLYETAAKLLRIFYGEALFDKKVRAEYKFLDAFLKEARRQSVRETFSSLEKIAFNDPHFQMIYYKMLKGTKKNDLLKGIGYPSLLDYIKIEPAASKICLYHAHPHLLSVFFTAKGASKIYTAIHTPKAPPITQEGIERICQEIHAPLLNAEMFNFFEMSQVRHAAVSENTWIGEDPDSQISLRKVVSKKASTK